MAWPCASAGVRSWRAVGGLAIPLLLAGWLLAAGASASPTQQLLIEDEHHLLELSHAEQLRALDQMQALGVDKVRAVIWWRYLLADPGARTKPRGGLADPDS